MTIQKTSKSTLKAVIQVVQALFGHAKFNPTQTMKIVIDRLERNLPQYQNAEEIKAATQAQLMAALGENSRGKIIAGNSLYQVSWPTRNYKAKPAERCATCSTIIKPATEAKSVRQKTISIKEQNDG